MPVAVAMVSTPSSVVSRSSWARRMRWVSSHRSGVVPLTEWKWRVRWRELMPARRARSSTVIGWSSRCMAQGSRSASGCWAGAGTGVVTNWAWPPSRWGGTTSRRATALATAEPRSWRTRCRHRSIAAALPAEVSTRPSSTYRTSGSTSTPGWRVLRSAVCAQCVVARRPSRRPAAASTNAPVHRDTRRAPASWEARTAVSSSGGGGWSMSAQPGTITVSASGSLSRPWSGSRRNLPLPTGRGAQTTSSYQGPFTASGGLPNTSRARASSKFSMPSVTATATVWSMSGSVCAMSFRTLTIA